MALRAASVLAVGTALALTLCGCGASAPPVAPGDNSNRPPELQPGAQNGPGPKKGQFFLNQPGAKGAPPATPPAAAGSK